MLDLAAIRNRAIDDLFVGTGTLLAADFDAVEAEIERLQKERDSLEWLLDYEYQRENPGVSIPCWLTVAASTREAAEAAKEK